MPDAQPERLPALMKAIDERWWDDQIATRYVTAGKSGEYVECGAKSLGWGNPVQSQLRKLAAIHLGYPPSWVSSVSEPRWLGGNWNYSEPGVKAGPFESLGLANEFNFGDTTVSCDWLPPLLREWRWHVDDKLAWSSSWEIRGRDVSWDKVEAMTDDRTFDRINYLTKPVRREREGGRDPQQLLFRTDARDRDICLEQFVPEQGQKHDLYRSLPITVLTGPTMTVTTTITAAVSVNQLIVPIKVFAIREHRPTAVGDYWDEIVGWVDLLVNPDRMDNNFCDGTLWFRRSYRLTDLDRWQGFVQFHSKSNGKLDRWQLFPPSDLSRQPPLVSQVVDWDPISRDGKLHHHWTEEMYSCERLAPGQLRELTVRLCRQCSNSRLAEGLNYGLLSDPPQHLVDLLLEP